MSGHPWVRFSVFREVALMCVRELRSRSPTQISAMAVRSDVLVAALEELRRALAPMDEVRILQELAKELEEVSIAARILSDEAKRMMTDYQRLRQWEASRRAGPEG